MRANSQQDLISTYAPELQGCKTCHQEGSWIRDFGYLYTFYPVTRQDGPGNACWFTPQACTHFHQRLSGLVFVFDMHVDSVGCDSGLLKNTMEATVTLLARTWNNDFRPETGCDAKCTTNKVHMCLYGVCVVQHLYT